MDKKYTHNKISFNTGALKDEYDERDYSTSCTAATSFKKVDLSNHIYNIKNQSRYGSCVAHALATSFEIEYHKKYNKHIRVSNKPGFSEGWFYSLVREINGFFPKDMGLYPRQAMSALYKYGLAPEAFQLYDTYKASHKSNKWGKFGAAFFKIKKYERVNTTREMQDALAEGKPIMVCMKVDGKFRNANYKIITSPDNENYGGHATVIVGMHKENGELIFKGVNSWGKNFGDKGYYYVSAKYITKQLYDAYIVYI